MADMERVLKGLECCILRNPDDHARCSQCSYGGNCVNRLKMDALELLDEQQETISSLQGTIRKLSAALEEQAEQKRGHWMYGWTCSVCKERLRISLDGRAPIFEGIKCCPNCGAKMED